MSQDTPVDLHLQVRLDLRPLVFAEGICLFGPKEVLDDVLPHAVALPGEPFLPDAPQSPQVSWRLVVQVDVLFWRDWLATPAGILKREGLGHRWRAGRLLLLDASLSGTGLPAGVPLDLGRWRSPIVCWREP